MLAGCLMASCAGGASHMTAALPPAPPTPQLMPGPGPGEIPDTWTGIHAFQVFDSRISHDKAVQDAYRYDLVWGTVQPTAWKQGNPRIIVTYYAPFDGDFSSKNSLTWWKQNHPDWILYKCDEKTPAWPSGLPNVPLDISNPAVVQWQMATYGPVMESGYFGGLAADLVGLDNASGGCGVFINGVWTQRFSGQPKDDAWSQAVLAWMRYAFGALHREPRPLSLGVNHVPESRPFGDPEEADLLNHIDYTDDESSFTDYGNGYASNTRVASILQYMKYVQQLGKAYIVDDKWNTRSISQQQLGWSIGTYMLGKYHSSSVYIDHLPGYGYEYWYQQYLASVGNPCGDYVADKTHPGAYERKYTGAYVVVNATYNRTFTITLPQPSYTSIFGGKVTSPLTIAGDTGAVLLTTKGCQ